MGYVWLFDGQSLGGDPVDVYGPNGEARLVADYEYDVAAREWGVGEFGFVCGSTVG